MHKFAYLQYNSGKNELFVTDAQRESDLITMFGIQTAHQIELWKKMAPTVVIVDSTACVSKYKHVLYSVVSVGKDNVGHVLAWLVVESESKAAIVPLLEVLKERCGETKPRLFVSDDAPALWNSWLVIDFEI